MGPNSPTTIKSHVGAWITCEKQGQTQIKKPVVLKTQKSSHSVFNEAAICRQREAD